MANNKINFLSTYTKNYYLPPRGELGYDISALLEHVCHVHRTILGGTEGNFID